MSTSFRLVSIILFLALVVNACNLPGSTPEPENNSAGAVLTAAAQTVEANLTQAAIQNPPTVPVVPTSTTAPPTVTLAVASSTSSAPLPTATSDCDDGDFVTDVTIPDGTILDPNESFTKTWRLKNSGTCSWTPSYAVVFSNGDSMNGPTTQALAGNVNPGQTMDISVNLKAPASPGDYTGYWKLRNAAGVTFATFYVTIKVSGAFAVTSVNTTVNPSSYSGPCTDAGGKRIDFTFSADITTNAAGTVTYKWERSDNANAPEQSLTFASAGTKTVTTTWSRWFNPGDNATGWERIYINNPNHQAFSNASFTVTCDP